MPTKNMNDPVPGVIGTGSMKTDHLGESVEPHPTTPPNGSQYGTRAVQPSGFTEPVLVGAFRGDIEGRRIDRLEAVALDLSANGVPVRHLYDHKGRLSVNVQCEITAAVKQAVQEAWERVDEYVVEAFYSGTAFAEGTEESGLGWFINELLGAHDVGVDFVMEGGNHG